MIQEIAYIIVPKSAANNAFWDDAARNELIGLFLYEYVYCGKREFIDIIKCIMNTPLQEHLEGALNGSPRDSLVASYLTSLASSAEETLFSVDLTLAQRLYPFLSDDAVYFFRDNVKRTNPTIYCDSKLFQIECAYEKDGLIGKLLELFLASDDEYGTEEDWLERYEDAENHYTDYEYKYNGEEVN